MWCAAFLAFFVVLFAVQSTFLHIVFCHEKILVRLEEISALHSAETEAQKVQKTGLLSHKLITIELEKGKNSHLLIQPCLFKKPYPVQNGFKGPYVNKYNTNF